MDHFPVLSPPPPLADIDKPALFLDFDGTLVGIAETPDAILVPRDLAARLGSLGQRLDGRLALISGRAVDDLGRHLGAMAFAPRGDDAAPRLANEDFGGCNAALGERRVRDRPGARSVRR